MITFSRFSVLDSEVDIDRGHKAKPKLKVETKVKVNAKPVKVQQSNLSKQATNTKSKKKSKDSELQALAFGQVKKSKKKNQSSAKTIKDTSHVNGSSISQNEEWFKQDEKFVKEENEKALKEAILRSKLDYEHFTKKKEAEDKKKPSPEESNQVTKQKSNTQKKKKDKPLILSLEQFNSLPENELEKLRNGVVTANGKPSKPLTANSESTKLSKLPSKDKFFNDVDDATQKTLDKEVRQTQYKEYLAQNNKIKERQQVQNLTEEIEKRDFEIQALRLEVDSLKDQLLDVKSRNKKLCEIIGLSEMRSKSELAVELQKAYKSRDEFSETLTNLTVELEQEKTKVSQLTQELRKQQGKKRNVD